MKRTIISILMLCILLIGATVSASPKSDLREIWDNQTFEDGRYQIYLDAKFNVLGTAHAQSIIDIVQEPFFMRTENTVTMFGVKGSSVGYLAQEDSVMHCYYQKGVRASEKRKKEWVHFAYDEPNEQQADNSDMTYNDLVRSVEQIKVADKEQLYAVKLNGRKMYKKMKKSYEQTLVAGSEEAAVLDSIADKEEKGKMLAIVDEILKTWKDTDNLIVLVRVNEGKITGLQTEIAPQFNAMMHIIGASADMQQTEQDSKLGGLMEAFLQVEKMRLTVVPEGKPQYTEVPEEVLAAAIEESALTDENTDRPKNRTAAIDQTKQ